MTLTKESWWCLLRAAFIVSLTSGCFEYDAQLKSAEPKIPADTLDDPTSIADPTEPDDPTADVVPDDETDLDDQSEPASLCEYICTPEGPFCDYEECERCDGCCDCNSIPEGGAVCGFDPSTFLVCEDGCAREIECEFGQRCISDFLGEARCERCTPCDEPGQTYCGFFENRDVMYRCDERFCLDPMPCGPGQTCVLERQQFDLSLTGRCVGVFDGCEENFCSGVRICNEPDDNCGPCGCCEPDESGDFCGNDREGMVAFQAVPSFDCYEYDFCQDDELCKLSSNGDTAFCTDF